MVFIGLASEHAQPVEQIQSYAGSCQHHNGSHCPQHLPSPVACHDMDGLHR